MGPDERQELLDLSRGAAADEFSRGGSPEDRQLALDISKLEGHLVVNDGYAVLAAWSIDGQGTIVTYAELDEDSPMMATWDLRKEGVW